MLREVVEPLGGAVQAFICGPTLLVESAADGLVQQGLPPAQIRTERFGPASLGPGGLTMEYLQTDVNQELMLDANAVAGVLQEIFGVEMTAAPAECAHCGQRGGNGHPARLHARPWHRPALLRLQAGGPACRPNAGGFLPRRARRCLSPLEPARWMTFASLRRKMKLAQAYGGCGRSAPAAP